VGRKVGLATEPISRPADQLFEARSPVEVWLEKDALAGVVMPVTSRYDVPLMVARGYASLSFLHTAAEYINSLDVPAYIYHLSELYRWLNGADFLVIRADRLPPLVVIPLSTAIEVAKAAERNK
jgi:hypothetical protein